MIDQAQRASVAIDAETCTGCGGCIDLCPAIAIRMINNAARVNSERCKGCYSCTTICPVEAPYKIGN